MATNQPNQSYPYTVDNIEISPWADPVSGASGASGAGSVSRNAPRNININQRSRKIDSEEKLVNYIYSQLGSGLLTVDVTRQQVLESIDDAMGKFTNWAYDSQQHMAFVIQMQAGIQDYLMDSRILAIYDMSIADTTSSYADFSSGGISLGGFGMVPVGYVPYVDPMGNASSLSQDGASGIGGSYSATGVAAGVAGPNSGGGSPGDALEAAWAGMANAQTMQNLFGKSVSYDFNSQNHILRIFEDHSGPVIIEAALEYQPCPEHDDIYGHSWIKEYSLNLTRRIWSNNLGKFSASLVGGSTLNYDRMAQEADDNLDRLNNDLLEKWSPALGIFSG